MICGIYEIKNLINNKIYIGSSINIEKRKNYHFWMLKNRIHDNILLQNSFNKHGIDNFKFNIVEECSENDLVSRENFYILKYMSNNYEFGYNLATVNEFRRNSYGDLSKKKMSKSHILKNGNYQKFSLEDIKTGNTFIFETLVDASKYLKENGFAKGKLSYIRMKISYCLRNKKVNNDSPNGSIRKTCYKHKFLIIE